MPAPGEKKNISPPQEERRLAAGDIKLPFEWEIHPFEQHTGRGVFAVVIMVGASVGAAFFMRSVFWGFFAFLVLFFGVAKFFFPTRYLIDSKGIREAFLGHTRVAGWSRFRRAVRRGNEVFLSPFAKKHFMDRFRGWLVIAPNETVAQFIEKKVNDAAG